MRWFVESIAVVAVGAFIAIMVAATVLYMLRGLTF